MFSRKEEEVPHPWFPEPQGSAPPSPQRGTMESSLGLGDGTGTLHFHGEVPPTIQRQAPARFT